MNVFLLTRMNEDKKHQVVSHIDDLWKIDRLGRQPSFLIVFPKVCKQHSLPKKTYTNKGLGCIEWIPSAKCHQLLLIISKPIMILNRMPGHWQRLVGKMSEEQPGKKIDPLGHRRWGYCVVKHLNQKEGTSIHLDVICHESESGCYGFMVVGLLWISFLPNVRIWRICKGLYTVLQSHFHLKDLSAPSPPV